MDFLELGFGHLGDCRDFKVIVGSAVGNKPRSAKDSVKDFGLETLYTFDVDWLS